VLDSIADNFGAYAESAYRLLQHVITFSVADNGQERTVTDLRAGGATKFYEVEITKP